MELFLEFSYFVSNCRNEEIRFSPKKVFSCGAGNDPGPVTTSAERPNSSVFLYLIIVFGIFLWPICKFGSNDSHADLHHSI